MIDEILDEFDFEKAHKVMVAIDWQWQYSSQLPSVEDLRRHARSLLRVVIEGKGIRYARTNGFTAYKENGIVGLRFEVSSYGIELEKGQKDD
jgi:hypothetical protein